MDIKTIPSKWCQVPVTAVKEVKIDISVSDINSNSTCNKLNLPFDIACYHCKDKLNILINRRVNMKQKTERQKIAEINVNSYRIIIGLI